MDAMGSFTALPLSLQRGLEFPDTEGASFVRSLHAVGGWAAVDAVAQPTAAPVDLATTSPRQAWVIDCDDDEVRVGIGPTIEAANRAIGNPASGS